MMDPTGKSRGFGFVSYEKHEDANKVLSPLLDLDFKISWETRFFLCY